MNVGPSNTSSFHVVGTIFDRAWIEGNPDNQFVACRPCCSAHPAARSSSSSCRRQGSYVMVDHHFANASQGAIGLIAAGGKPDEHASGAADTEHHNIPATGAPTDPVAVRGKLLSNPNALRAIRSPAATNSVRICIGVTRHRDEAWLSRWMKNPEQMLQTDPLAKEMLANYKIPMPNQNLSDEEVREYIAYFKWADTNLRPQGKTQPQPAAPGTAKNPSETFSATPVGGRRPIRLGRANDAFHCGRMLHVAVCRIDCGVCDEDKWRRPMTIQLLHARQRCVIGSCLSRSRDRSNRQLLRSAWLTSHPASAV